MLRVLTLSTLFPDAARPSFGVFVERQTIGLAAHPAVELKLIAPIGVPRWPLGFLSSYRWTEGLPEQERWRGIETYRPRFQILPGIGGKGNADRLAGNIAPLIDRIRADFAFDVIDAQFFFPDGPAAIALGKRYGVPVSIKARGADIHYWGRRRDTAPLVRRAAMRADGVLAVSAALKADIAALGVPAERIRVHYTGVDLDRFTPADRAAAKAALGLSGPVIACVGALIERKGQALAIEAIARMPEATLLLVGEGRWRARLEAQARPLGNRVRFLGSQPHDAPPAILAAADAMVLPSASEGLANAWVEALAAGVPIVIADVGGARELLGDARAGRIVPREAGAIAAALSDLIAAPPDPQCARALAERFTWEANRDALFAHLSGLVAERA